MITVDPRVGSKEFVPLFQQRGVPAKLHHTNLPSGDFSFIGNGPDRLIAIGIERKTYSEIVHDAERLLQSQIPRMKEYFDRSYLIVEGGWRPNHDGIMEEFRGGSWHVAGWGRGRRAFPLSFFTNFEAMVAEFFHMPVYWSRGKKETVMTAAGLQAYWSKPWAEHLAHVSVGWDPQVSGFTKKDLSQTAKFAATLDGVGVKGMFRVARKFKTPLEMCCAGVREWREVAGIGKIRAGQIVEALQGKGELR